MESFPLPGEACPLRNVLHHLTFADAVKSVPHFFKRQAVKLSHSVTVLIRRVQMVFNLLETYIPRSLSIYNFPSIVRKMVVILCMAPVSDLM